MDDGQVVKGIVDPYFFRSEVQFFGEVWSCQSPEIHLFLKYLNEGCKAEAWRALTNLVERGYGFLNKMDGPFILVYFNRHQRKGFFYRSFLCKSPLYYRRRGRQWLWGMAVPDLLEAGRSVLAQVDSDRVLDSYLHGGLPETASFYRDIHRLPAGGLAEYENERIRVRMFDVPSPQPHLMKWRSEDLMSYLHDAMVKRLLWREPGRREEKMGVLLSDGEQGPATVSLLKPFSGPLVAYMINEQDTQLAFAQAQRISQLAEVPCVILEWEATAKANLPATWLPSFRLAASHLHYWREQCVHDRVTRLCYDAVFAASSAEARRPALFIHWERWRNNQPWSQALFPTLTLFSKRAKEQLLARELELRSRHSRLWPIQSWLNEEDALFYTPFWREEGLRFLYPALSREWLEVAISVPKKHALSLQLLSGWMGLSANLPAPFAGPPATVGRRGWVPPYLRVWTGKQWLEEHPHLVEWQWVDPDQVMRLWTERGNMATLWEEMRWMKQVEQWLGGLERLTVS
ncbi:hypothetical protein ADL26_12325 [Thermoactinomyces vulgaris]|jgi:hypothetical protein|uniref:Acetyltransferase (GNAT) family protein n=1 Tax=Laceyella sediminis TaxID=573074 RepID=A0ABX5EN16_9BACL|nr:hypothetical protein [Laceyella sediminis]KPC73836.1 hypothetical protein ADL26_12325 [Thermoactinomyces vulgaris]PRZ12286.1 hypothetical protein CLV36_11551 [Laceyella sediminis]